MKDNFELFVAPHGAPGCNPEGHNAFDGLSPDFSDGLSGPCPNLDTAIRVVRAYRATGRFSGQATITLLPGDHYLLRTQELTSDDNGGLIIRSQSSGAAKLWGGQLVESWEVAKHKSMECWEVSVEEHLIKNGPFRSLWVSGRLASRPRWPKQGEPHLRMKNVVGSTTDVDLHRGSDRFIARSEDIPESIKSWDGVDVCVPHFWIEERMPVESVNRENGEIVSTHVSRFCLTDSYSGKWARYYFDNVESAFCERGQWFLDRERKVLRYLPQEGETLENTKVVIPLLKQLLRVRGQSEGKSAAEGVHLENLGFYATDWEMGPDENMRVSPSLTSLNAEERPQLPHETVVKPTDKPWASACQGAFNIPAAVEFSYAQHCSVKNCHFSGIGWYGLSVKEGSSRVRVQDNHFEHLGGGGILIDGGSVEEPFATRTSHIFVDRNHIHHDGYVFPGACGILCTHAAHVRIADNHLHNLTYSGISAGWTWSFADTVNQEIRILRNHIHDLGERADMSDMGGIYLLGKMPASVVAENKIHAVQSSTYGGWGLYADWGTSFVTFERNLVFGTKEECVHEHWARQNLYRDNLLISNKDASPVCLSGEVIQRFWNYPDPVVRFEHNTFLTQGTSVYTDNGGHLEKGALSARNNRFWDIDKGDDAVIARRVHFEEPTWAKTLEQMQADGLEIDSKIADPELADFSQRDFRKLNSAEERMPFVRL